MAEYQDNDVRKHFTNSQHLRKRRGAKACRFTRTSIGLGSASPAIGQAIGFKNREEQVKIWLETSWQQMLTAITKFMHDDAQHQPLFTRY